MSIFDDKTIKPKRSKIWIFAPLTALLFVFILWANFDSQDGFSWGLFFALVGIITLILTVWKVFNYLRSGNSEVREYEAKMKKLGRR